MEVLALYWGGNNPVGDIRDVVILSIVLAERNSRRFFLNTPLMSSDHPQFVRTGELNRVFTSECSLGVWRILNKRRSRPKYEGRGCQSHQIVKTCGPVICMHFLSLTSGEFNNDSQASKTSWPDERQYRSSESLGRPICSFTFESSRKSRSLCGQIRS